MTPDFLKKGQTSVTHRPIDGKKETIETELWERFRHGDRDALVSIYKQFQKPLINYGFQFTKDKELVKDCIHELFVSLFGKDVSPKATTSVKFYLFRSLRRLIARETKKKKRFLWSEKEYFESISFQISLSQETVIIEQEQNNWQLWQLHKAVNKLPLRQREAIFYFFFEGFSYGEIMEIMEFKEVKTARTLIYRALNTLREDMVMKDGKGPDLFIMLFFLTKGIDMTRHITDIDSYL